MTEQILELIAFVLFGIHVIRVTFLDVFIWQLKEYRIDRILAFFSTNQGKKFILNPLVLIKLFLLITSIVFYWHVSRMIILGVYITVNILENILIYKRGIKNFKLPVFTLKATLIIIFSILILIFFLIFFSIDKSVFFQILERLIPFIILLVVLVINLFSFIIKRLIIRKAKEIISRQKNIISIGITGSFGKTTTKYFLNTILSKKFNVLSTAGSHNTEIGVAKNIIQKLAFNTAIFIAEMGAYKKGEIEAICKLVNPKIGIITGINEQHAELFGSIRETMKTKYELIKNLAPNGIAIFNMRNYMVQELVNWAISDRKDLILWGYQRLDSEEKPITKKGITKMLYAKDIISKKNNLSFKLIYDDSEIKCQANLLGKQSVDSILPGVMVGLYLGLSIKEISSSIANLKPPPNTMRFIRYSHKSYLIDNTFNANPDGVMAILEYMKLQKIKRKIIVFTPLIELGRYAEEIHRNIGKETAQICDLIILTNDNFKQAFTQGTKLVADIKDKIFNIGQDDALVKMKLFLDEGAIVAFVGKESKKLLEKIEKVKLC